MKAYVIRHFGGIEALHVETLAKPLPSKDEVVLKVVATGLNSVDITILSGGLGGLIKLPAVIGTDVSGVVEAVGENVRNLIPGDAVFGMINYLGTDGTANGHGYGEYAPAPATQVVKKPANLSFEEAAALSAVGLTAKQALEGLGNIQKGQRVLIHGAAGGVGHIAVQIAKLHGAYVLATANSKNVDFVRSIGADEVIDYSAQDFAAIAQDIDLVLDVVGGDVLRKSIEVLKPGGILLTTRRQEVSQVEEAANSRQVHIKIIMAKPNNAQLAELALQVSAGELRVHVDRVYPFDQLPEALTDLKTRSIQGKLVLRVSSDRS